MSLLKRKAVAVGLLVIASNNINKTQKKKKWIKKWLSNREDTSHINLMSELRCSPDDWRNYMRMDENTYLELLEINEFTISPEATGSKILIIRKTIKYFIEIKEFIHIAPEATGIKY